MTTVMPDTARVALSTTSPVNCANGTPVGHYAKRSRRTVMERAGMKSCARVRRGIQRGGERVDVNSRSGVVASRPRTIAHTAPHRPTFAGGAQ